MYNIDSREDTDKKVAFPVESHDSNRAYQSLPKLPDGTSPPDKDAGFNQRRRLLPRQLF